MKIRYNNDKTAPLLIYYNLTVTYFWFSNISAQWCYFIAEKQTFTRFNGLNPETWGEKHPAGRVNESTAQQVHLKTQSASQQTCSLQPIGSAELGVILWADTPPGPAAAQGVCSYTTSQILAFVKFA